MKNTLIRFTTVMFLSSAVAFMGAFNLHAQGKDIVETAVAAGQFTTLAKALQAAGLVDALKGKGPFTVFAPTDSAFAKLPSGTVESLLKDIPKLKSILLYHVVAGNYPASDVVKKTQLTTLQGQDIKLSVKDGVRVESARVIGTDVKASNGIIHVIDSVILPKDTSTKK